MGKTSCSCRHFVQFFKTVQVFTHFYTEDELLQFLLLCKKNAENGKICIFCSQSSLYRDFFPQGEEKFGSLKRELVIFGVRYMEGFYESFLRGKRGGTEFGS